MEAGGMGVSRISSATMINEFPPLTEWVPPGHGLCLDVGCGRSAPWRASLEAKGYQWIGVDLNLDPVFTCKRAVVADAHALPFRDGVFDVIFCNQVLLSLHSPEKAVYEIGRVVRDGGQLYGKTSMMECFNNSYFHMTHLGIRRILEGGKLHVLKIWPGANVFYLLFWGLFFNRKWLARLAARLTWTVIQAAILIHEVFHYARFGTQSKFREHFTQHFDLYYAGHIGFIAEKYPPVPSHGM